ncbi:uncharacterized protein LOC110029929 isoform X3 [Phalaenopsis equestris]|uniref:uncharacterized protein LOC110029929 isoform X3 n=1 Tax=Phalaenopsis equestris TaxID=78828 RepID=UPI0009E1CACB|nr:uncharacterized protein LOC110029929 isoform X3 [Phalaenopsis equestris]
MALASGGRFMLPLIPSRNPPRKLVVLYSQSSDSRNPSPFLHHSPSTTTTLTPAAAEAKRCLRCSALYADADNSPTACAFHGHTTGATLYEESKPRESERKTDLTIILMTCLVLLKNSGRRRFLEVMSRVQSFRCFRSILPRRPVDRPKEIVRFQ